MNTVSVLPPERVDLIEKTLRHDGVSVPTLLKAQDSTPGFITLSGWVHGGDPICAQFPTGMVVCACQDEQFERLLHAFSAKLQEAQVGVSRISDPAMALGRARD